MAWCHGGFQCFQGSKELHLHYQGVIDFALNSPIGVFSKISMPTWKSRPMPWVIGHKTSNHFMMIFIHRRWRHWLPYSSFFQNLYNVFMYNVCTCVSHCTLYSLLTPIPFRAMGVDTLTMLTSWTHIPANRLFNSRQWFKFKFHPLIDDGHAFSLFSFWSNHLRTSSIVFFSWHWIGIALNVALHICKLFWTRGFVDKIAGRPW